MRISAIGEDRGNIYGSVVLIQRGFEVIPTVLVFIIINSIMSASDLGTITQRFDPQRI